MATVTLISATGRLKNRIEISYLVEKLSTETITDSGMIYSSSESGILSGTVSTAAYSPNAHGAISYSFEGIPSGRYYLVAYAKNQQGINFYSQPASVFVSQSGYEISSEGLVVASALLIADGTQGSGKTLVSDSSGLGTWRPIRSLFSLGHYIGELYGGGIVADVWREGGEEKVLIASLEDLGHISGAYSATGSQYLPRWIFSTMSSANSTSIPGAMSLYDGKANTDAIVAFAISQGLSGGSAAKVCTDYRGGGYDDWYLPSYYEMNSIYVNAHAINKTLGKESLSFHRDRAKSVGSYFAHLAAAATVPNSGYWTSTECVSTTSPGSFAYCLDSNLRPVSKSITFPTSYGTDTTYAPKIRAVRKESFRTSSGLCLSLDATNIKSYSDKLASVLGTASVWKDLVNKNKSAIKSSYPETKSGGSEQYIVPSTDASVAQSTGPSTVGIWTLSAVAQDDPFFLMSASSSSMQSSYFEISESYKDAKLTLRSAASDTGKESQAKLSIYVSVVSNEKIPDSISNAFFSGFYSKYRLISEISNTTSLKYSDIPLWQYAGKKISIKICSPSADASGGALLDKISVSGTTGGYQPVGPIYKPDQSGYLRFSSDVAIDESTNSFMGSYADFDANIGNSATVTVEVWARLKDTYANRMLFGWNKYSLWTKDGSFGFNTGAGDVFGISGTKLAQCNAVGQWAHFVFEMRSDVSYTNNKIYINGDLMSLSQQHGTEDSQFRSFNGGLGRIGGWRFDQRYLFNGDISVFRVYNRALSKEEVMSNYSAERKRYELLPSMLRYGLYSAIDFNSEASYSGDGTSGNISDLGDLGSAASLVVSQSYSPAVLETSKKLMLGIKRLYFPGTAAANPYITWTDSIPLKNASSISASFWIMFDEARTSEIIVKWKNSTNSVGAWEVSQSFTSISSFISFKVFNSAGTSYSSTGKKAIKNGVWTHVCAVYDGSAKRMKTYINGSLDIDYALPISFSIDTSNTGDVFVGQYPPSVLSGSRLPMKGSIANMQIYTVALGKADVINNYDAGKEPFESSTYSNYVSHQLNGPTFSIYQNLVLDIEGRGNEKLLMSDSQGKATWVEKEAIFSRPSNQFSIGDIYGGGIIVGAWKYPSDTFNYLIMSSEDVATSNCRWSSTTGLVGADSVHDGQYNSSTIMGAISSNAAIASQSDPDANAFISAAAITNSLMIKAIRILVSDLKASGIWSKMKAIYPFVGMNADAHRLNLRNISSYNLSFHGSWTHDNIGSYASTANGTYANMNILASQIFTATDGMVGIYTSFDEGSGYIFGASNMGNSEHNMSYTQPAGILSMTIYGTSGISSTSSKKGLLSVGMESDGSMSTYKNGTRMANANRGFIAGPSVNMYLNARNANGTADGFSLHRYSFAFVSNTLTQDEHALLYAIVQTYQANLARKTGDLVLSGAAKACQDYRGGGYSDWYLPSITELNQAFNSALAVDSSFSSDLVKGEYWSSTEANGEMAMTYGFNSIEPNSLTIYGDDSSYSANLISEWYVGYHSKLSTASVRAFRTSKVYEERRTWSQDTETIVLDEDREVKTGIKIVSFQVEEIPTEYRYISGQYSSSLAGTMSFTFSLSISTSENIQSFGVCWATSSAAPVVPSLQDNTTYWYSRNVPVLSKGVDSGISMWGMDYRLFFRAFLVTPTGVYYSSENDRYSLPYGMSEKIGILATTYSVSTSSGTQIYSYPTNSMTWHHLLMPGPSGAVTPSSLWTSIYAVYNADTLGTSLDTSIYRVYNGDNVNDSSGNAQNGTNVGSVTFTTGKVGNAFTFNGSNYISLPNNSLNDLTGDFSISCWVKIGSSSGSKMIIGNLTEATPGGARQGFRFEINGTFAHLELSDASGTTTLSAGGTPLTVGVWYHVVLTRKGSTRTTIYVNSCSSVTNADTRNPSLLPTMYTTIGANRYGTSSFSAYFNGSIDAVTVWNKELTIDEVTSLYNGGLGAEYPFSSQTLLTYNDALGNYNGTSPSSTLTNGVPGPSFTTGKIGKAFQFDGINDYIQLPDNSLNLTGPFSYSFWIKSTNTTDYTIIVGNIQNPRGIYSHIHGYHYWLSAGKLQTEYVNGFGTSVGQYSTTTIANGVWNHVVVTYNPNNSTTGSKVYINGTLESQTQSLGLVNPIGYSSPMKACIGARNFNGTPATFLSNGTSIDMLSAWNKELSATEVTELYNSGNGKQYPN